MNRIFFNEPRFEHAQVRDVINFTSYIINHLSHLPIEKLSANDYKVEKCNTSDLMCNVTITFQVWDKNESGLGKKYEWNCYRAINFSCSNISHKEVAFSIKEVAALASI